MANSSHLAMSMNNTIQCDENSTSECHYVNDEELYDYYASLMLLMTGLPQTFKTILIVLYTNVHRQLLAMSQPRITVEMMSSDRPVHVDDALVGNRKRSRNCRLHR